MSIHRFAKMVLLAPAIGSALIGVLGLLIGVVLIMGHGSGDRMLVTAPRQPSPSAGNQLTSSLRTSIKNTELSVVNSKQTAGAQQQVASPSLQSHEMKLKAATLRGKPAYVRETLFEKPVAPTQFVFLSEFVGQPADNLIHEQRLRNLVNEVVPYAPFHLGLDMPLPNAIESMFSVSTMPLEIRDGRYAMLTGIRGSNGRGRAFLWIDMQEGIALAGIFFYPSNGEPTPTLTIFSRQVDKNSLRMSQLPKAFVQDLSRWSAAEGVPLVTTRYFINASSEKTVLAHDENYCNEAVDVPAPSRDVCKQMNADARDIDKKAVSFLGQTHNASNATMHMIANASNVGGRVAP